VKLWAARRMQARRRSRRHHRARSADGVDVRAARAAALTELQRAGGKRLPAPTSCAASTAARHAFEPPDVLPASVHRHPSSARHARAWPRGPGIAAWGLMTGVAMVKSGMSVSRRWP
jgi:hypothetical protein